MTKAARKNPRLEALEPYVERLRELPFVVGARTFECEPQPAWQPDGAVELSLADGSAVTLLADVKLSHLPANYRAIGGGTAHEGSILMAPHVGAPLGEALEGRGINFIDRQGNCHVNIENRHVARIQGRPPLKVPARSKELRAAGYRVMFALLAEPELLGKSYREIAAAAGASSAPVSALLGRLVEERLVVRRGRVHHWVEGPSAALLERWVAGYASTLRPKLEVGRFRLPVRKPEEVEAWVEERLGVVRYGGTAGAYRLEPHYRGPLTVAHLGPPSADVRRQLRALPSAEGDLLWMRHIGECSARGETPDTVHPLLIYGELMSDPDPRAGEAAQLVREKRLPWSI